MCLNFIAERMGAAAGNQAKYEEKGQLVHLRKTLAHHWKKTIAGKVAVSWEIRRDVAYGAGHDKNDIRKGLGDT